MQHNSAAEHLPSKSLAFGRIPKISARASTNLAQQQKVAASRPQLAQNQKQTRLAHGAQQQSQHKTEASSKLTAAQLFSKYVQKPGLISSATSKPTFRYQSQTSHGKYKQNDFEDDDDDDDYGDDGQVDLYQSSEEEENEAQGNSGEEKEDQDPSTNIYLQKAQEMVLETEDDEDEPYIPSATLAVRDRGSHSESLTLHPRNMQNRKSSEKLSFPFINKVGQSRMVKQSTATTVNPAIVRGQAGNCLLPQAKVNRQQPLPATTISVLYNNKSRISATTASSRHDPLPFASGGVASVLGEIDDEYLYRYPPPSSSLPSSKFKPISIYSASSRLQSRPGSSLPVDVAVDYLPPLLSPLPQSRYDDEYEPLTFTRNQQPLHPRYNVILFVAL